MPGSTKWLITGLNGTLAPVLARQAAGLGVQALARRGEEVPPKDTAAARVPALSERLELPGARSATL